MDNKLLLAVKKVNDSFLHWQVTVKSAELFQILKHLDWYNEFNPARVEAGIEEINNLVPPMNFGETSPGFPNPNNGKPHHKFCIGREGSMVLYLDLDKFYMPKDFDYTLLENQLASVAKFMKADEYWTTVNTESSGRYSLGNFTYRFWWD